MPILAIENMHVRFSTLDGDVHAVKGVELSTFTPGETVAIVGESGSGKSQLMMAAIGLLASNGRAEGSARYQGPGTARPRRRASSTKSADGRSP